MSLIVAPDRLLEISRMVPFIEGVSEGETEPACEWVKNKSPDVHCDRSAAWSARSRCCGIQSLGCDPVSPR